MQQTFVYAFKLRKYLAHAPPGQTICMQTREKGCVKTSGKFCTSFLHRRRFCGTTFKSHCRRVKLRIKIKTADLKSHTYNGDGNNSERAVARLKIRRPGEFQPKFSSKLIDLKSERCVGAREWELYAAHRRRRRKKRLLCSQKWKTKKELTEKLTCVQWEWGDGNGWRISGGESWAPTWSYLLLSPGRRTEMQLQRCSGWKARVQPDENESKKWRTERGSCARCAPSAQHGAPRYLKSKHGREPESRTELLLAVTTSMSCPSAQLAARRWRHRSSTRLLRETLVPHLCRGRYFTRCANNTPWYFLTLGTISIFQWTFLNVLDLDVHIGSIF
jgi:hypothetical protein